MKKIHAHIVTWVDSCTEPGWRRHLDDVNVSLITSIGYVVRQTKSEITLTSSLSNYGSMIDPLTIPRVAIKSMRRLRNYVADHTR